MGPHCLPSRLLKHFSRREKTAFIVVGALRVKELLLEPAAHETSVVGTYRIMRNSGARRLTFGVFIYIQTLYWRTGNAMTSMCICKKLRQHALRHLSTFYRTSLSVNF